eukprot:TRINITY_DN5407_c0_g1_i2.p1 TRINITY_DN5407_c0_g1~~TRINITY_DN5407_c0_g1_i2.p1  ORF type:complete len:379 (+),score=54.65 TRINITY_DN5407_c0_g1_i2:537-1673(+)
MCLLIQGLYLRIENGRILLETERVSSFFDSVLILDYFVVPTNKQLRYSPASLDVSYQIAKYRLRKNKQCMFSDGMASKLMYLIMYIEGIAQSDYMYIYDYLPKWKKRNIHPEVETYISTLQAKLKFINIIFSSFSYIFEAIIDNTNCMVQFNGNYIIIESKIDRATMYRWSISAIIGYKCLYNDIDVSTKNGDVKIICEDPQFPNVLDLFFLTHFKIKTTKTTDPAGLVRYHSDEGLEDFISRIKKKTSGLDLRFCNFTEKEIATLLSRLSENFTIKYLNYTGNPDYVNVLNSYIISSNIEKLSISFLEFQEEELYELLEALKLSKVQVLCLLFVDIGEIFEEIVRFVDETDVNVNISLQSNNLKLLQKHIQKRYYVQ